MKKFSAEIIGAWPLRRLTMPHRRLSTLIFVALTLFLAGVVDVIQAMEFKSGSYSGTRLRGDAVIFRFDDKGKFSLTDKNGRALVEGTYKMMKDQIEFTDENGPMASKNAKPGKYKWTLEDTALNFTKIEDESEGRSKGITGSTWTLEK
jgi:hypothetical protein